MAKSMKKMFRCYYGLEESEYTTLWKNAVFIFDANVLLNLYRYKEKTRDELLDAIDKLKERLWVPHQVALEFQRNRIAVINGQNEKFSKVKKIIEKHISEIKKEFNDIQIDKKHANIDPTDIISSLKKIQEDFSSKLDQLEEDCIKFNSDDSIRDRLDNAIRDNIGLQPENQEYLDNLYKEGEHRFNNQMPPGYKDVSKGDNEFIFSGLKYKNKYGDLIVWKQIIAHAKDKKLKDVIFVTDDNKDDWWMKDNNKTIGIRPELRDEIYREAKVDRFHIYNSEQFINYANKFLSANISASAIEEVKGIRKYNNTIKANATAGLAQDYEHLKAGTALAVDNKLKEALAQITSVASIARDDLARFQLDSVSACAHEAALKAGADFLAVNNKLKAESLASVASIYASLAQDYETAASLAVKGLQAHACDPVASIRASLAQDYSIKDIGKRVTELDMDFLQRGIKKEQ